jgi:hypothetical protein
VKRSALLTILPFLTGCVFGGADSSRVEKVPEAMLRPRLVAPRVPDRNPYGDVSKVRPGQWVSYRQGERTFTLAVAGAGGEGAWIEVIEEGEPRQVSARLISREGVVLKAFYGEISKQGRSTVEPQTLEQSVSPPAAPPSELGREIGEETVVVAGRELKARRIVVRLEDLEGRLTQEITLWHPDVPPVYAGNESGGLVRRQTTGSTLELVGFGTDARPLLTLPP